MEHEAIVRRTIAALQHRDLQMKTKTEAAKNKRTRLECELQILQQQSKENSQTTITAGPQQQTTQVPIDITKLMATDEGVQCLKQQLGGLHRQTGATVDEGTKRRLRDFS